MTPQNQWRATFAIRSPEELKALLLVYADMLDDLEFEPPLLLWLVPAFVLVPVLVSLMLQAPTVPVPRRSRSGNRIAIIEPMPA